MPGWTKLGCAILAGLAAVSPASPQSLPSMRLYVLDCGTLFNRDPATYGLTRQQVGSVNMSDPCFLIVHPQGTLLWETGLNDGLYNRPEGAGANHDKIEKSLKGQLSEIGYRPSDIRYLAISHLHGDHSGNANDYAGATWIVQKAERDSMFSVTPSAFIRPDEYAALKNSRALVVEGDHDVFGDGSVKLISTPGHSPGHQSLFVKLPKTGALILTGDLYHFPGERTFHTIPERERALETPASRAKIEALIQSTQAQLWIQHDIVGYGALKKSPAYYE